MKTRKYSKVTEDDFNKAKQLQEIGLSISQVGKFVNKTSTPVSTMFKSKTYQEYLDTTHARYMKTDRYKLLHGAGSKQAELPVDPLDEPDIAKTTDTMRVLDLLDSIDKSLKAIINSHGKRKFF